MSMSTYTELTNALSAALETSDISDQIPDFITFGENRINRELRLRSMETALSASISSGVISIPDDYLELKNVYIDGTPIRPLERKKAEWIYRNYPNRAAESKPFFIASDAGYFIFGPYPDQEYTVKGTYYAKFAALSSAESNWVTSTAPELIFFASMQEAYSYMGSDVNAMKWEAKYSDLKRELKREYGTENFSGSILRTRAG